MAGRVGRRGGWLHGGWVGGQVHDVHEDAEAEEAADLVEWQERSHTTALHRSLAGVQGRDRSDVQHCLIALHMRSKKAKKQADRRHADDQNNSKTQRASSVEEPSGLESATAGTEWSAGASHQRSQASETHSECLATNCVRVHERQRLYVEPDLPSRLLSCLSYDAGPFLRLTQQLNMCVGGRVAGVNDYLRGWVGWRVGGCMG